MFVMICIVSWKSLFFLKVLLLVLLSLITCSLFSDMDVEPAKVIPEPVEATYATSKDAIDELFAHAKAHGYCMRLRRSKERLNQDKILLNIVPHSGQVLCLSSTTSSLFQLHSLMRAFFSLLFIWSLLYVERNNLRTNNIFIYYSMPLLGIFT
jgi:hypothetical protein